MARPHKIRLAGPWEWIPDLSGTDSPREAHDLQTRRACVLPFSLPSTVDGIEINAACLFRRFHRPTGLTASTTVRIALLIRHGEGGLWLNGNPLTGSTPIKNDESHDAEESDVVRFTVPCELLSFNEVQIRLAAGSKGDSSAAKADISAVLESVWIEIHEVPPDG